MKIAFIGTEGIPGNYGGFETFVDNVSYRLVKIGHEVTVYQPWDYQVDLKRTKYENVNIKYVKCSNNKYLRAIMKRMNAFRKIKKKEFDIIHNFGNLPYLFKIFNSKGITVATIDGFEWKRESYSKWVNFFLKRNFRRGVIFPHIPIVDSKVVQQHFSKLGLKTWYLPYGTNFIEENSPLKEKFLSLGLNTDDYFYFVGRFVKEKNIHRLINDYKKIQTKKKLLIIGKFGSDTYSKYLISLAKDDKRIIFSGPAYGQDYINLITNSSGYISTSLLEGTSPALLDALGARRKVLISDIPENRATLNNLGHFYPLDDSHSSLKVLNKFVNNQLYTTHEYNSMNSYANETYNWDNIIKKYLKIIGDFTEN